MRYLKRVSHVKWGSPWLAEYISLKGLLQNVLLSLSVQLLASKAFMHKSEFKSTIYNLVFQSNFTFYLCIVNGKIRSNPLI